jgi:hypothetical protein
MIPPKPVDAGEPFPERLNDGWEIAAFIVTYAPYGIDEEFVAEQFFGKHAALRLVPVSQLREGGRDHNLQSPENEKYQNMDLRTLPPLLVEGGEILDGNHRFRASAKRGLAEMWCYVVEEDS